MTTLIPLKPQHDMVSIGYHDIEDLEKLKEIGAVSENEDYEPLTDLDDIRSVQ